MGVTRVAAALAALKLTQYIEIVELVHIFEDKLRIVSDELQNIEGHLTAEEEEAKQA